MDAPVLVKAIPSQIVNERAAYGPFDLKEFIQVTEGSDPAKFHAVLSTGAALPVGLICTEDGLLTGIPGKDTQGSYEFIITAQNAAGALDARISFTIKPSLATSGDSYLDDIKAQVWEALGQNLPIPSFDEINDRPVVPGDVYYLLERWGTLTMWNVMNLDPASNKTLLHLEGASPHYEVYDCVSCLIMAPKDLFSHERTLEDALQTARAMAREIYKRDWTVQMAGFDKFVSAAWVEIQLLGRQYGKQIEVINFSPSSTDAKLYTDKVFSKGLD